jgi:hypothetical protein
MAILRSLVTHGRAPTIKRVRGLTKTPNSAGMRRLGLSGFSWMTIGLGTIRSVFSSSHRDTDGLFQLRSLILARSSCGRYTQVGFTTFTDARV